MKAIVEKLLKRDSSGEEIEGQPTNVVIDMYDDDKEITVTESSVELDLPSGQRLVFSDLNSSNVVIAEDVTQPADYAPHKYTYDADADPQWALNAAWVDPDADPDAE